MNGTLRIIDRGTLVRSETGTDGQSCTFPSVVVLPSGRWLVGFRASRRKWDEGKQHIRLTWSDDQGATWTKPGQPIVAPTVNDRPGRFRMGCVESLGGRTVLIAFAWQDYGDPDRPLFNPTTSGTVDFKEFFAISEDEGETWGELTKIDDAPFDGTPTPLTGPIRVMPNGDWACQFETNKTYDAPGPWPLEAVMLFSSDKGKTWPRFVKHAFDPAHRLIYGDARPRVMPDGSVLCFYWTFDSVAAEAVNIHATRSDDGGRTWTEPWDTGVPGQSAPPISLPNGDVAIAYVDRTEEPTIKVRTSRDRARTFSDDTELELRRSISPGRRHGDHEDVHGWVEDIELYTIGLPDTAILADPAEFIVVYYNGIDQDHTDLEWVRLRTV